MQLFILDENPQLAAEMLCDVHLRKMCLETAQILSSVLFLRGEALVAGMPRPYNPAHPVIAAVDTPQKINWVVCCNNALHREYIHRYGKMHAYDHLCSEYQKKLWVPGILRFRSDLTFARNFKGIQIDEPDIIQAYRQYYRYKKTVIRHWRYTNADEPGWLRETV